MATAAEFEAKLERISEYEHDDTDQARCDVDNLLIDMGTAIREWDTEDVEELLGLLTLLKETARSWGMTVDLEYYGVDMTDLPTVEIPNEIADYPVWAVDRRGRALVGAAADEVVELNVPTEYTCSYCGAALEEDNGYVSCPVYIDTGDENHTSVWCEEIADKL
jgi:hypothetical protein